MRAAWRAEGPGRAALMDVPVTCHIAQGLWEPRSISHLAQIIEIYALKHLYVTPPLTFEYCTRASSNINIKAEAWFGVKIARFLDITEIKDYLSFHKTFPN